MAILATLIGCQGIDEFTAMLPAALNFDMTPVEVKEIVYQAVAYLGIGRVFPFLKATNAVLEECGIELPLPGQAMTTTENRRETGTQAQDGCELQLTSHAAGNMKVGNDKAFLIKVISQCLPYIGYPRSLNALTCVNKAAELNQWFLGGADMANTRVLGNGLEVSAVDDKLNHMEMSGVFGGYPVKKVKEKKTNG